MKVFVLNANVNVFPILTPAQDDVLTYYQQFNGTPLPGSTQPLRVEMSQGQQPQADFPGLATHIPAISQRAVETLIVMLREAGELAPLSCKNCDQAYHALNVTRLVDGLDPTRVEAKRFSSSRRIMRITRYAFLPERVSGLSLFKIPETALQEVYATGEFLNRVAASDLRGFVFNLVWTDEAFVILCPYCSGIINEGAPACPTCGLDPRNDAPWEVTLSKHQEMPREACRFCGVHVPPWADPCPYCLRGQRRQGKQVKITIV